MKKLNFTFFILLFGGLAYGQVCSDLFISEIVFGKQGSSLNGGNTQQLTFDNFSVELFNPTDGTMNLSAYKVELFTSGNVKTEIPVSGNLTGKGKFVLSNPSSSTGITDASDALSSSLNFDGKVMLKLTKNGIPIDVIGQEGVGDEVDKINIDSLLNDPSYLQSLGLDLRSIENLTVRRRAGVQEGNTDFIISELLQDWEIYPHFFIDNLGIHENVCSPNSFEIRWVDNTGQGFALAAEDEEAQLSAFGVISGEVELDGVSDESITMEAPPAVNPLPEDSANEGDDFDVADPGFNPFNEFDVFANNGSNIQVPICIVYDDNEIENLEVAAFRLQNGFVGGQTVFIGFPEFCIVSILNDDVSATVNLRLQKEVTLYPTVSNNFINLSSDIPDLKFEGLYSFSLEGKHEHSIKLNDANQVTVDISTFPSGYHALMIYTSGGVIAKRFIKF